MLGIYCFHLCFICDQQCESEAKMIKKIQTLCGSFDEAHWPGITKISSIAKTLVTTPTERIVKSKLNNWILCKQALDLIDNCLMYENSKRITAFDALNHDYFWIDPMPLNPASKLEHVRGELNEMNRKNMPREIWW